MSLSIHSFLYEYASNFLIHSHQNSEISLVLEISHFNSYKMPYTRRVMERIEREEEEIRWRCVIEARARAAHAHEVNLVMAMLDQERQKRHGGSNWGHAPNKERERHSGVITSYKTILTHNHCTMFLTFEIDLEWIPTYSTKLCTMFATMTVCSKKSDVVGVLGLLL